MATSPVEVIASNASVKQAAAAMASLDVGALPVVDDEETLIGMISDRDIVIRVVARGLDPAATAVSRAMTAEIVAVPPDADLDHAAGLMQQHQVRRLPLIDDNGHAVGIMALADLAIRADAPDLAARTLGTICQTGPGIDSPDA